MFDLVMHEYGASLREIDAYWTPGRTLLYLRRIAARYEKQEKQTKRKQDTERITSIDEMKRLGLMRG